MAYDSRGNRVTDSPKNAFQVTGQQQSFGQGPDGRAVSGVRVMFVTEGGVHSEVFLADSQYNPDNVRAAILAKAHQLDTVSQLKG